MAARELEKRNQPLYAFNWIETPAENYDPANPEWGFATQLANMENIEQKSIRLTPEFMAEMYDTVDITKEDITYFWGEYLARDEAEKYKVRTFLSGWGGDELISYDGYSYLPGLIRQGRIVKAIKEINILYKDKNYKYLRIIKRSLRELIYPLFYKQMAGLYKKRKSEFDHFEFIWDNFSTIASKYSFPDTNFPLGVHNEQKALFAGGHILQRIENWTSSAFEKKLEYSFPLLDKRIVEFALAVPEDLFSLKEGHQRYFFRSAISNFLPENIAWAAKNGEPEHGKAYIRLWDEALRLWMQKNEKISESRNYYVDSPRIIRRIKMYITNKENGEKDNLGKSRIVASILLSNLKGDRLV